MKSKEVKRSEAIARNEKHRAKYINWFFAENPKVVKGSPDGDIQSKQYANERIGIPSGRPKKTKKINHAQS